MMTNYFITINYRAPSLTAQSCKRTLENCEESDCRYVVVDNSELSGSDRLLYSAFIDSGINDVTLDKGVFLAGKARVIILKAPRNGGFSYGNNIGIDFLTCNNIPLADDVICFINNDAFVNGGLEATRALILDNQIYGATLIDSQTSRIQVQGGSSNIDYRVRTTNINEGKSVENAFTEEFEVKGYINGAFMAMNAATLNKVGKMDESYFMWCEEIDWCLNAVSKGVGLRCLPQIQVVHQIGATSNKDVVKRFLWRKSTRNSYDRFVIRGYYHFRNKNIVFNKYFKSRKVRFYFNLIKELFIRSIGVILYDDKKIKRISIMIKGIWHGISGKYGRNDSL